jgi:hypothetical protein
VFAGARPAPGAAGLSLADTSSTGRASLNPRILEFLHGTPLAQKSGKPHKSTFDDEVVNLDAPSEKECVCRCPREPDVSGVE